MEGRVLEIYTRYVEYIKELIPLEDEEGYLKAVIHFHDGTNLRVNESWEANQLIEYSYYWLTRHNQLKIGWDNSPHHRKLENFPHHKHVTHHTNLQPSDETTLDAVMKIVTAEMKQQ